MHEDEQRYDGAAGEIDNRRGGIPPAAHRLLHPEERGDGKREETHGGKNDVGEDLVEGSEEKDKERAAGLQEDGVGRGSEAGMQPAEDGEERSVSGHGVVDAGRGHGEGHEASSDGEQDAGGENAAAGRPEERLSELGDEGGVGDDLVERDDGEEGEADQEIDSADEQDSAGEGERKRLCGIAYFAGELSCFPPASEAEEGVDDGAGDGGEEHVGAGAALGEREKIRGRGVSGDEGPGDEAEENGELEQIGRGHYPAAEAGSGVVDHAEHDENRERQGDGHARRDRDDGLNVGNSSEGERGGDAGIDDGGRHPAIKKSHARAVAFAEVDVFASHHGIAHRKLGVAKRSGKSHERHAAPDGGEQRGRAQRFGHRGGSEKDSQGDGLTSDDGDCHRQAHLSFRFHLVSADVSGTSYPGRKQTGIHLRVEIRISDATMSRESDLYIESARRDEA